MQVVWKKILEANAPVQTISVPQDAEFLCAREQHNQISIWFRANPDAPKVDRTIHVVATGYQEAPKGQYLGTALLNSGEFVLHVFVAS